MPGSSSRHESNATCLVNVAQHSRINFLRSSNLRPRRKLKSAELSCEIFFCAVSNLLLSSQVHIYQKATKPLVRGCLRADFTRKSQPKGMENFLLKRNEVTLVRNFLILKLLISCVLSSSQKQSVQRIWVFGIFVYAISVQFHIRISNIFGYGSPAGFRL